MQEWSLAPSGAPENLVCHAASNGDNHRSRGSRFGSNPWWLTAWARRVLRDAFVKRAAANQVWWLSANPCAGLPPPFRSAEAARRLERNLIAHHIKAGPGQLVRHRLGRHHGLGLGLLALVERPRPMIVADRHVRRLDERPSQVLVAAFAVALDLLAPVGQALGFDAADLRRVVAGPGEAAHIARLQTDRHAQNIADAVHGQQRLEGRVRNQTLAGFALQLLDLGA